MSYELASIVLPVYAQVDHIARVVRQHAARLSEVGTPYEIILVVNGPRDGSLEACRAVEAELSSVRVVESEPGWGNAVICGLNAARGDLLCYANSARTSTNALVFVLSTAVAYPGVVIKANRKTHDNFRRRLGSLVFNLECHWLFDTASFDVNGTPKAFPRSLDRLMTLTQRDSVLDAEFDALCRAFDYPVIEVPIESIGRHGGTSTTNLRSALRLYFGVYKFRKSLTATNSWFVPPGLEDRSAKRAAPAMAAGKDHPRS